jgi:hypothetical protein
MNPARSPFPDPVSVRPLLRSIVKELRERLPIAHRLEARMRLLSSPGGWSGQALQARAELAAERRALCRIERELEELGWSWEPDGQGIRLIRRLPRGLECLSWDPERTGFWPRPELSST